MPVGRLQPVKKIAEISPPGRLFHTYRRHIRKTLVMDKPQKTGLTVAKPANKPQRPIVIAWLETHRGLAGEYRIAPAERPGPSR